MEKAESRKNSRSWLFGRIHLIHNSVVGGEAVQRIFLHLNADKSNAGLCGCGELALCGGGDSQPVRGTVSPSMTAFPLPEITP